MTATSTAPQSAAQARRTRREAAAPKRSGSRKAALTAEAAAQAAKPQAPAAQPAAGNEGAHTADAAPTKGKTAGPILRKTTLAALEAARRGELPPEPDFSANTYNGAWRRWLATVTAAGKAGDLAALYALRDGERGTRIPKGAPNLDRYLAFCILAVEAKAQA